MPKQAQVKWFQEHEVMTGGGVRLLPTGTLCWVCGTALEVFCLTPKEDLIAMYENNIDNFREKFTSVRAGVQQVNVQLFSRTSRSTALAVST